MPVLNPCSAKSAGEQRLATQLQSFVDPSTSLAFSVDFIPGCREIDLLLVHENLGMFVIEIKAVPLSAIDSVSPNTWVIKGRVGDESPLRQAYSQFEGLRAYWLAKMSSKLPVVTVTACLPSITRAEWIRAFKGHTYAESIAEGMLFLEDLRDNSSLKVRLEHILSSPPIRKATNKTPAITKAAMDDLIRLFKPSTPQSATISDRARLEAIERQINKELLKDFPPDRASHAVFTGHPGTGKTFRLLSIATAHAYAGKKVLFACFNKTLASDVRRLLQFNEKLALSTFSIDVADIFQLAIRTYEMNRMEVSGSDPDGWGEMVVNEMKDNLENFVIDQYDTVVLDEAHDLKDWQLDLVSCLAKSEATVCIAVGRGQELYRADSSALEWLEKISQNASIRNFSLRRNFRNTKAQFFAALAFHEAWPDKFSKIESSFNDIFVKKNKSQELEIFGRDGEGLTYIPLPAFPGEFEHEGVRQVEILAEQYASIIHEQLETHRSNGGSPVAILVLVPTEQGQHADIAREAFSLLKREDDSVSYIDYTDETKRRSVASTNDIRLCTFHSARGLEGEIVVIFGLETIESLAEKTHVKPENLGFIALSRGLFSTIIVARTYFTTRVHPLLKEIDQVLQTSVLGRY